MQITEETPFWTNIMVKFSTADLGEQRGIIYIRNVILPSFWNRML